MEHNGYRLSLGIESAMAAGHGKSDLNATCWLALCNLHMGYEGFDTWVERWVVR